MGEEVTLRMAQPGDRDLLFRWVNDEACRNNAFYSENIDYETHCRWFADKMRDPGSKIFILTDGCVNFGQIRIDIKGDTALISYSVDMLFRGLGYGTELVELLQKKARKWNISKLIAEVKKNNFASRHIFQKMGFIEKEKEHCFCYEKRIGTDMEELMYETAERGSAVL